MSVRRRFIKYVDGRKYGIEITETGPGPLVHITTDALVEILRWGGFTEKENTLSNLIHCDGPSCTETRDPSMPDMRRLAERGWLRVEEGPDSPRDFHDPKCLARWAMSEAATIGDDQPCLCSATAVHSVSQHQTTTTATVDGR